MNKTLLRVSSRIILLAQLLISAEAIASQETFHPLPKEIFAIDDYLSLEESERVITKLLQGTDHNVAQSFHALFEALKKNIKNDDFIPIALDVHTVTESFSSLCNVKDRKIITNKRFWQFSLSQPYVEYCDILLRAMQWSCYITFVRQAYDEQEEICESYHSLADILHNHDRNDTWYSYALEQSFLFTADAGVAGTSVSSKTAKEKRDILNNHIDNLRKMYTYKDPALEYDGWIVYGRTFYRLAHVSQNHPSLSTGYLSLALESFHQAAEIVRKEKLKKKKNETPIFNNFVFHRLPYLDLATDATARSAKSLAKLYEHEDAHRGNIEDYRSYLVGTEYRLDELVMELAHIAADLPEEALKDLDTLEIAHESSALISKDKNEENIHYDELTQRIMEIEKHIRAAIEYYNQFLIDTPKDHDSWVKKYRAQKQIELLSDHLLPNIEKLTYNELTKLSQYLTATDFEKIQTIRILYTEEELQAKDHLTSHPLSDLFVIEELLGTDTKKEIVKTLFYRYVYHELLHKKVSSHELVFFHKEASVKLQSFFTYPMPSEYVLEHAQNSKDLNEIYTSWLSDLLTHFEEEHLKELVASESSYYQAEAQILRELFTRIFEERKHFPIELLEKLYELIQKDISDYLDVIFSKVDAQILNMNSASPLERYVLLELQHRYQKISNEVYQTILEKEVLKKPLEQCAKDSVLIEKITESFKLLGYEDVPADFALAHLKVNGTRLESLRRLYVITKIQERFTYWEKEYKAETFEAKQTKTILSFLDEKHITPHLDSFSIDTLQELKKILETKEVDLVKLLSTIDPDKKWHKEKLDDHARFVWIKILHELKSLTKDEYRKELEKLLILEHKDLFEDPSFISYLKRELIILGFVEIQQDPEFIKYELTDSPADLIKIEKLFMSLPENKRKNYEPKSAQEDSNIFDTLSGLFGGKEGGSKGKNKEEESSDYYFYQPQLESKRFIRERFHSSDGKYFVPIKNLQNINETFVRDGGGLKGIRIFPPAGVDLALIPSEGYFYTASGILRQDDSPISLLINRNKEYLVASIINTKMVQIQNETEEKWEELRKYYRTDHLDKTFIEPSVRGFTQELFRVWNEYVNKEEPFVYGQEKWDEFIRQAFDHTNFSKFPLLPGDHSSIEEVYLLRPLESWIQLHVTYNHVGTPINKITLDDPTKIPDWGKKLEKIANNRLANCAEGNALFQYIVRHEFGLPARMVTGYASDPRKTNAGYKYSKKYDENYKVIDPANDGHAWSEVLIGDHWVTFDATPYAELEEKGIAPNYGNGEGKGDGSGTGNESGSGKDSWTFGLPELFNWANKKGREWNTNKGTEEERTRNKEADESELVRNIKSQMCEETDQINLLKLFNNLKELLADSSIDFLTYQRVIKEITRCSDVRQVILHMLVPSDIEIQKKDGSILIADSPIDHYFPTKEKIGDSIYKIPPRSFLGNANEYRNILEKWIDNQFKLSHLAFLLDGLSTFETEGYAISEVFLDIISKNTFKLLVEAQKKNSEEKLWNNYLVGVYRYPLWTNYYIKKYGRQGFPQDLTVSDFKQLFKNTITKSKPASELDILLVETFKKDLEKLFKNSECLGDDFDTLFTIGFVLSKNDLGKELSSFIRKAFLSMFDRCFGIRSWTTKELSDVLTIVDIEEYPVMDKLLDKYWANISVRMPIPHDYLRIDSDTSDLKTTIYPEYEAAIKELKNFNPNPQYQSRVDNFINDKVSEFRKSRYDHLQDQQNTDLGAHLIKPSHIEIDTSLIKKEATVDTTMKPIDTAARHKAQKLVGKEADVVSSEVLRYADWQVFDPIGAIEFLQKSKSLMEARNFTPTNELCERFTYFYLDIDQALRSKTPDKIKNDLIEILKSVGNVYLTIISDIFHIPGGDEPFEDQIRKMPNDVFEKTFRTFYTESFAVYSKQCIPLLITTLEKTRSRRMIINWIHVKTLLGLHFLHEKKIPSRDYLFTLLKEAKGVARFSNDERSIIPRLLDLILIVIPYYAINDSDMALTIARELKEIITTGDLNQSELFDEGKRFILMVAHYATAKNQEDYLTIFTALSDTMKFETRLNFFFWLAAYYNDFGAIYGSNEETLKNAEKFLSHTLSRIDIQTEAKGNIKDPVATTAYSMLYDYYEGCASNGSLDRTALISLLGAARNALVVDYDQGMAQKFLDLILSLVEIYKQLLNPELANALKNYFHTAYLQWGLWNQNGTQDSRFIENTKRMKEFFKKLNISLELPELPERKWW